MTHEELETRLEQVVRKAWTHNDAAHDISHLRRVRRNALSIADTEGEVNIIVLLAAVWLHDLVQMEKDDPQRVQASLLAADAATKLLTEWNWPDRDVRGVAHAIEAHSYSAGIEPCTIEAKILRDADRLDAIGAVGIARTFSISGRLGRALYDDADPKAQDRPLDDTKFGLDHFYAKLLKLGDGMMTDSGRKVAAKRIEFMNRFVDQFLDEVI